VTGFARLRLACSSFKLRKRFMFSGPNRPNFACHAQIAAWLTLYLMAASLIEVLRASRRICAIWVSVCSMDFDMPAVSLRNYLVLD